MIRVELEAHTVEEWREKVAEAKAIVREWRVPVSVGCSGTPHVLEEHDKRVPGTAHFMAHGYQYASERAIKAAASCCTHSLSVRSTCTIPEEDNWFCRDFRDELLDEGYITDTQTTHQYTHLFHCGKNPKGDGIVGYLSFGMRGTDEEAIAALLRDFRGIRLRRLKDGVYLGLNEYD